MLSMFYRFIQSHDGAPKYNTDRLSEVVYIEEETHPRAMRRAKSLGIDLDERRHAEDGSIEKVWRYSLPMYGKRESRLRTLGDAVRDAKELSAWHSALFYLESRDRPCRVGSLIDSYDVRRPWRAEKKP